MYCIHTHADLRQYLFFLFWIIPKNQSFEREKLQKDGILHMNKNLQLRQLTKSYAMID